MPKQNITNDELLSWLHQELQWGDIHRKPFYEAIKAQLLSGRECAGALSDILPRLHSTDRDNMEFILKTTCFVRDKWLKLRATAIESGLMEKQG